MSRSNYNDDCDDNWGLICWRGAVASAIRGKRGQAFLHEMIAALDALLEPKLIVGELEEAGAVCAIGAVGKARGTDMADIDPSDSDQVAGAFHISPALAREIVYENDECGGYRETPEARHLRMRTWAVNHLRKDKP